MKKINKILVLFLICICSFMLVACDKEFNPGVSSNINIAFSLKSTSLKIGEEKEIKINCTLDLNEIAYNVSSNNESIVTVSKTSTGIKIKGLKEGSTKILLNSEYGVDSLSVNVSYNSVSLTTSNYSSYLTLSKSNSGANVTVSAKGKSEYVLDYSLFLSVTIYVSYKYYPTSGISQGQQPSITVRALTRSMFLSEDSPSDTENFIYMIEGNSPGAIMISYSITSISINVTNVFGTAKY